MSNNNENFFTKKHTKATHRGRYVLMVLYAFYAFASQGFFTAIISTAIVSAIIYFVIDAMWKSIGKNAKEQREKEFLKEEALEVGGNKTFSGAAKTEELSEGEINNDSKNKNCNINVTLQREKIEEDIEIKKKKLDKKEREEERYRGERKRNK